MNRLIIRKSILLALIAATTVAPLLFLRPEGNVELSAVKFLAKTGSLAGVILLFWQMLLGFRGIVAKLIPDYIWVIGLHKTIGKYALPLILLHPVFITVFYLMKHDRNVLLLEGSSSFKWYVACGMLALALIALIVITSVFLRSRLSRSAWYYIHLSSYLVLPLVFVHSFPIGMTLEATDLRQVWILLACLLVGIFIFRILSRLGIFLAKYTVVAAEQLAPEVILIRMRPAGKPILPQYSQFAFVRRGLKGNARPFTISGFDRDTGEIAVTVKASGRTTTRLQEVQPEETMYVEGPYGIFGLEAMASSRPIVMMAGGIGITAFKRMIDKLAAEPEREAHLFYGSRNRDMIIYKDELESISHVEVVHVLSDDPSFQGEHGFVTAELMRRHLTQPLVSYEFLVCGPPVMINKLEKALLEENVPRVQIHHELFGY